MTGIDITKNNVPEVALDREGIRRLARAVNQLISEHIPNIKNLSTTTYTVNTGDDIILCDASSASIGITLQLAKDFPHANLRIIKTDSSVNTVTYTCAGSDTVNGASSGSLTTQYQAHRLENDGISAWYLT